MPHVNGRYPTCLIVHCFFSLLFKTQYFPYISNRDIPKVTKRQHPKLEFGHKLGEVFKKLQKVH
jgi:hypothetical protein